MPAPAARQAGGGTAASAVGFGGYGPTSPSTSAYTYEWNAPDTVKGAVEGQVWYTVPTNAFQVSVMSVPQGTWASGGALNTARAWIGGAGTLTAGLAFGGSTAPTSTTVNNSESYNGTAWTEGNNLNTARKHGTRGGGGIQTAALYAGGDTSADVQVAVTEKYDGTSWTEENDLNTARRLLAGAGTQASNIVAGGDTNPAPNVSNLAESWDGTSWTEVAELNTARKALSGAGSSNTAAIVFGGDTDPTTHALTEIWDGSSWTETADLNTDRRWIGAQGTSTSALGYGGYTPGAPAGGYAATEEWNGSSWSNRNDMVIGRSGVAPSSGATGVSAGFAAGGDIYPSNIQTITEEWTAPIINKTITMS